MPLTTRSRSANKCGRIKVYGFSFRWRSSANCNFAALTNWRQPLNDKKDALLHLLCSAFICFFFFFYVCYISTVYKTKSILEWIPASVQHTCILTYLPHLNTRVNTMSFKYFPEWRTWQTFIWHYVRDVIKLKYELKRHIFNKYLSISYHKLQEPRGPGIFSHVKMLSLISNL